jgi:hypothetical protein
MSIEPAVREPGVVHEVGHADPVDPILADARRGNADDLLVVLPLVGSRVTHPLPSPCVLTA